MVQWEKIMQLLRCLNFSVNKKRLHRVDGPDSHGRVPLLVMETPEKLQVAQDTCVANWLCHFSSFRITCFDKTFCRISADLEKSNATSSEHAVFPEVEEINQ